MHLETTLDSINEVTLLSTDPHIFAEGNAVELIKDPTPARRRNAASQTLDNCIKMAAALLMECEQITHSVTRQQAADNEKLLQFAAILKEQSNMLETAAERAETLSLGNSHFSAQEMSKLFSHTLADSIEKIVRVSKRSMEMVYLLDEAISSLSSIERFVADIQMINRQAKLLALNASIEAARTGEMGNGFSVVANEVNQVSSNVQSLATSMQQRINRITHSVQSSYSVLQEIATTDLEATLESKEKLDEMLGVLLGQHASMRQSLLQAASDGNTLAKQTTTPLLPVATQLTTGAYAESITQLQEQLAALGQLFAQDEPTTLEARNGI